MTIFGPDFSHYDASPGNIGARVSGEGFTFFTHKAGGDANDTELNAWWNAVKNYRDRMLVGAYWVLYPGSATSRADAFLSRLDSQCPGWRDGPFILQVDCEKWNNDSGTVPNRNDIRTFCDRLAAKMPKLRPIVYAPAWVYGNTLNGLGYPLWASSYVGGSGTASALYPGDSSGKWAPYSGQTPAILQFSSSAVVAGQTTCDVNAFRGTLAELSLLVAPGWREEIDMPLTDDDVNRVATAVIQAMQSKDGILAGPSMAASVIDGTNPTWTDAGFQRDQSNLGRQILAAVKALPAPGTTSVDVDALAMALAPKINGMTESEVKDALKDALREGTGPTA